MTTDTDREWLVENLSYHPRDIIDGPCRFMAVKAPDGQTMGLIMQLWTAEPGNQSPWVVTNDESDWLAFPAVTDPRKAVAVDGLGPFDWASAADAVADQSASSSQSL